MNKQMLVFLGAFVVLVLGVGGWYVMSQKNMAGNKAASSSSSPSTGSSNSGANNHPVGPGNNINQPDNTTITINNFAFSPASITVQVGTTITWKNNDSVAHTVTESDGKDGPNSGTLNPGSSYSFKFTTAGSFHYHCTIHTDMNGVINANATA